MQLSAHCYAVMGLGYVFPWAVNAAFITGDDSTLILDTGANTLSAATIHGYANAVRPGNQLCVLNLEKHFDHIGGNSFFAERGIPIWGHPLNARTAAEFQGEAAELNRAITHPVRRARNEEQAFLAGAQLQNPNCFIEAEQILQLGGIAAHILFTPGHTATNLSVWVPEERVLFTADCLVNGYLPNLDAASPEEWPTWLASLDRIEALQPQTIVCGHGPVARGSETTRLIQSVRHILQHAIKTGRAPTSGI